jgi:NinB protein
MKFVMSHDLARRRAIDAVTQAPAGYVVTVKEPSRSLDQNAKFHAMCSEMNGVPYYGKARNAEDWKTLFVSGHTIATGGLAEVIPGLEGEFVNIRESTARMSKSRSSSLIDYADAFIAQRQKEAA